MKRTNTYLFLFLTIILAFSGCIGSDDISTTVSNGTTTTIINITNISNHISNYSVNVSGQLPLLNFTSLIAGGNVTLTQDDTNHTITITSSSGTSFILNATTCNPANQASSYNGTGFECVSIADSDPYILLTSEPFLNVNSSNYWNYASLQNISISHTNNSSVTNLLQAYNLMWSTGVINGGEANFTDSNTTGTNVTINSGIAVVHETNNDAGNLMVVDFPNTTLFVPYLTNFWIYVDYSNVTNTASVKSTQTFSDISGHAQVSLYKIFIEESNESQIIDARAQNVDTGLKLRRFLYNVFLYAHASGGNTLGSPSGLNLTVTAGEYYYGLNPVLVPAFDTTQPILPPNQSDSHHFEYYYFNTSAPLNWTDVDNSQRIDATNYNPTSGLTAMSNNKYKTEYIYYELSNNTALGSVPAHLVVIYGQKQYNSFSDAAASSPPTNIPPSLREQGILIGRIIIQKGNTTINQVDSIYTTIFTSSATTNHNNLAGLQGGTTDEYFHLTSLQYSNFTTEDSTGTFPNATSIIANTTANTLSVSKVNKSGDNLTGNLYINQNQVATFNNSTSSCHNSAFYETCELWSISGGVSDIQLDITTGFNASDRWYNYNNNSPIRFYHNGTNTFVTVKLTQTGTYTIKKEINASNFYSSLSDPSTFDLIDDMTSLNATLWDNTDGFTQSGSTISKTINTVTTKYYKSLSNYSVRNSRIDVWMAIDSSGANFLSGAYYTINSTGTTYYSHQEFPNGVNGQRLYKSGVVPFTSGSPLTIDTAMHKYSIIFNGSSRIESYVDNLYPLNISDSEFSTGYIWLFDAGLAGILSSTVYFDMVQKRNYTYPMPTSVQLSVLVTAVLTGKGNNFVCMDNGGELYLCDINKNPI